MYNFPQYRKYPNNKSFFRIISAEEFEELQIIGSRYRITRVKATILPDRNFINDMLADTNGHWTVTDEKEYRQMTDYCREKLQPVH